MLQEAERGRLFCMCPYGATGLSVVLTITKPLQNFHLALIKQAYA